MSNNSNEMEFSFAKLSLADKRKYLEENKEDCSFIVGNVCIKSHKIILMEASDVFKAWFNGSFKKAKDSFNLLLEDVDPFAFKNVLSYIYDSDINLRNESIASLKNIFKLAEKYGVETLKNKCKNDIFLKIDSNLSSGEMLECFDFMIAYGRCYTPKNYLPNLTELENLCNMIRFKMVQEPDMFTKSTYIFDWDVDVFFQFVQCVDEMRSILKFFLIETYCKVHDCDQKTFKSLLKHVDFSKMTKIDFCNGPAKSKLLSMNDKLNLLQLTK